MDVDRERARRAAEHFGRANLAYHEGRYDAALPDFRTARLLDPTLEKATHKIAGILRHQGQQSLRSGKTETALEELSEAWSLQPDAPRMREAFVHGLRAAAADALSRGFRDHAASLLLKAHDVDPDDAETSRMSVLLDALPAEPFSTWMGTQQPEATDLVLIEAGVDDMVAGVYLGQCDRFVAYTERTSPHRASYRATFPTHPLLGLGSAGLPAEVELAADSNCLGAELTMRLGAALPPALRTLAPLDLIDSMSFEIDSLVFEAAKGPFFVQQLLRGGEFGRVLFLVGDGRLTRATVASAREALGSRNVFLIWCSSAHGRYDRRGAVLDDEGLSDLWRRTAPTSAAQTVVGRRPSGHRSPNDDPSPDDARAPQRWRPKRRKSRARPVAILPAPGTRHFPVLAPVALELSKWAPVAIVELSTRPAQHEEYLPYHALCDSHPAISVAAEFAPVDELRLDDPEQRQLESVLSVLADDGQLHLNGSLLGPLVNPRLHAYLSRMLPAARSFAQRFARFLDERRPRSLVLARERQTLARLAIALARSRGIPSLAVQPYLMSAHPMWNPMQTDYAAVVDDFAKRVYVQHLGARSEQVLLTGIPRFDVLQEKRQRQTDPVTGEHRPDPARHQVLLVLQRFSTAYSDRLVRVVATALAPVHSATLEVKLHPSQTNEDAAHLAHLLHTLPIDGRWSLHGPDEDIHEVMIDAHVVVAVWSTSILEAAMLGKLVLRVNLTGEPMPIPFVELGVAIAADSEEEVTALLPRCLLDRDVIATAAGRRDAYLQRNAHLLARPASEQIAEAVLALPSSP